jgi:arylsulfatase A
LRRAWIAGLVIVCLTLGLLPNAFAAPDRPNVVFILIDDLGYADVGCFGSSFYQTPNVDRLARQGMRFTNGYAACPVCSPTRASIQTGKNPARLHLTNFLKGMRKGKNSPILPADYADYLPVEEVTLGDAFKAAGYATCFVGKWHLGPSEQYWPQNQGYDVNIGGWRSGMPRAYFWPQWQENPPIKGDFDGQYLTDLLTNKAVEFVEQHAKAKPDQPFFLFLSHYAVHIPIQAKSDMIARYQKKLADHPPKKGRQNNPFYAAMIESMDQSVGRVLDTLDQLKLADNTIVVFFGDNGGLATPEGPHTPATINHPFRGGKGQLYEGGIREPMIVKWPGVTAPGSASDEHVISDDFFPTLCEMTGVKAQPHGQIDGISFASLLKDPNAGLNRKALYWHYPHFSNQFGSPGAAVRVGDLKLIERYEDGSLELYNLKDDIGETKNLADQMPQKAAELRQMLDQWRSRVKANMPKPNPDYKPG